MFRTEQQGITQYLEMGLGYGLGLVSYATGTYGAVLLHLVLWELGHKAACTIECSEWQNMKLLSVQKWVHILLVLCFMDLRW